jgi:hypothetical protein
MTPSLYTQPQSLPKTPYAIMNRKPSVKLSNQAKPQLGPLNNFATEEINVDFEGSNDIFQLSPSFVRIGKTLSFDMDSPLKKSTEYEDELAEDEEFLQLMDRRSNISKEELSCRPIWFSFLKKN